MARAFALLDDDQLREQVNAAAPLGAGIGGTTALVHVADTPVFVKRVPLTDLERRPENVRSTANLFDLPMSCHYGVASPGFGAWRELLANEMATGWVLAGRAESFPLLYHARVLEGAVAVELPAEELARHDSVAVQRRVEAIARASATVALFLEYLPQPLPDWLAREVAAGGAAAEAAITLVERRLRADVASMNDAGLFHFDAHLGNLLTDGERLYFCDLGLATSPHFQLSPAESRFLATNRSHDACHTITRFVDWLVTELTGAPDWLARNETLRRVAAGADLAGVMPCAQAIIARYAPIAVVINEFYRRLHLVDRSTPYPLTDVQRACDEVGF